MSGLSVILATIFLGRLNLRGYPVLSAPETDNCPIYISGNIIKYYMTNHMKLCELNLQLLNARLGALPTAITGPTYMINAIE